MSGRRSGWRICPFVRIPVKVAPRVGDVEDGADHEENDD